MSNGKKTLAQEFSVLFNLPWYIFLIFGAVVVLAAYMGVLPQGMAGCFAFMIVLGAILGKIGDNTPIIKDYLGGGAIVIIFGSAALNYFGVLPEILKADGTKALEMCVDYGADIDKAVEDINRVIDIRTKAYYEKLERVEADRKARLEAAAAEKAAAKEQAENLLTKENIYNEAKRRSEEMVVQTQNRIVQIQKAGYSYMDESLRQTEEVIVTTLNEVRDTRMKFRSVTEAQEQRKNANVDVEV